MTLSDLEWISKIFDDMECRAASLQQLSFLFSAIGALEMLHDDNDDNNDDDDGWDFFNLLSVGSDLRAVRRDDAEGRTGHVDGDVVGGEVWAKPEVKPDVAASGARVAVDRYEAVSVVRRRRRAAAGRFTFRRQMERHLDLQSSVVGEASLHPANIT